jgi:hypothetical protein
MPGEIEATAVEIQRAVEGLNASSHALARAVADMAGLNARLMAAIPAWVDESAISNATDTSVIVTPATRQLERITGLLAIVPTGTTSASLKLGNRLVIPLQNTVTLLSPISKLLAHHEPRVITYAPAGIAFLWLWGEQTAEAGFLDGGTA